MTAFIGATLARVGSTGRIWVDAHKTIALAMTSIGVTPPCSTISRSRHGPAASAITIARAAALSNVSRPAGVPNMYSTCVFGRASRKVPSSSPQITPGKSISPRRRHDVRNDGCVVKPGRSQFVNESADIRHVGYIAVDVSGHRSLQTGPLAEPKETIEKFKERWLDRRPKFQAKVSCGSFASEPVGVSQSSGRCHLSRQESGYAIPVLDNRLRLATITYTQPCYSVRQLCQSDRQNS